MTANLHIRDFGPIRDCELTIHKYTILIGPQASGKSTIAKVLAIIHSTEWLNMGSAVERIPVMSLTERLRFYRLENYLRPTSYWLFEDADLRLELHQGVVSVTSKGTPRMGAYYLPAERIALPMINESLFELSLSDSSLPKYFLEFGKDFTVARGRQKEFYLSPLGVEFARRENRNTVNISPNRTILLEEASSAIQANVPILVILQYPEKPNGVFVIEELELHGFPALQKSLLYYVVERMRHPKLQRSYVVLPTHSPYILSAANNLLFATKVARQRNGDTSAINAIIPEKAWIAPEEFAAYYVQNGHAESILDPSTHLIAENRLDDVSEDLAAEFDALAELYKPANA